ncbi:DUF885 domain-containing protein [Methylocystis bryophila]|uniref:DUF885 domain-containing protein n=1 Tax=Methylocystis bryophila TaxID=655015 RepID=A0A1W6N131_9HYPH|nr:DUF885 domain-containing protein [Methylocystis bryophila]ARN83584.1 hypothetical protein B1812_11210 [Methylocystis bryophila]BDV37572.1 hypothetical protein DSM21852_08250 [Methylocystis bryophila]
MRSFRFVLSLLGIGVVALLSMSSAPALAEAAAVRSFQSAVGDYYREEFRAHPILATLVGVHDHDAEVDDLSQEGHALEAARLHKALDAFSAIDPATLSQSDRDDREVLISDINARLLDVDTIRNWRKDPGVYTQSATSAIFALVHRDFAPLADRLRSVIARERQIPAMLANGRANIEHPPLAFVEIAIRNISGSINLLKRGVPAAFASVQDDRLKQDLAAANDAAIAAFESYKSYLEELKPKADGVFALGPELFAKRAAYSEMVDIPPDRLLEIAHAQLDKDKNALSAAAHEIDAPQPVEAVLKQVRAQHPTADALIGTASDDLAGLRAFVQDHRIATIPSDLLPEVEETPEFRRATTAAALDSPGALETHATQAFYYVTPPDTGLSAEKRKEYLEAYFFAGLKMISSHEVWPGHFMQYLARRAHPEWSLARKMAHAYSTTEGWAHYAEQMMVEEGLGNGDPKLKLAQLQMALMRDCRFVAAIELHTKGKSVDDAAEIFMKQCGSPEPEARREAYRGARDPGYMNYTLGKLQILKLREDYRAKRGDKFSLMEFHDRLLGAGLPPIKIIRREMLGEDGPTL